MKGDIPFNEETKQNDNVSIILSQTAIDLCA